MAKLAAGGIVGAERGGRLRMSWHVYNDESDVDRALEALG
jgi:selenocysteine lyase/cysteine desulfurase